MFGELFGFFFFVRGIPIFPCELQATHLILPPKNYDDYHWYLCQLSIFVIIRVVARINRFTPNT